MNKFQKDMRDLNGKLIHISILIEECTRDIERCIASLQGLDPEPEDEDEDLKHLCREGGSTNVKSNNMVFGEDA